MSLCGTHHAFCPSTTAPHVHAEPSTALLALRRSTHPPSSFSAHSGWDVYLPATLELLDAPEYFRAQQLGHYPPVNSSLGSRSETFLLLHPWPRAQPLFRASYPPFTTQQVGAAQGFGGRGMGLAAPLTEPLPPSGRAPSGHRTPASASPVGRAGCFCGGDCDPSKAPCPRPLPPQRAGLATRAWQPALCPAVCHAPRGHCPPCLPCPGEWATLGAWCPGPVLGKHPVL